MTDLYIIMDGRACLDTEDATILEVCDTIEEARKEVKNFGDAVICCSRIGSKDIRVLWNEQDHFTI